MKYLAVIASLLLVRSVSWAQDPGRTDEVSPMGLKFSEPRLRDMPAELSSERQFLEDFYKRSRDRLTVRLYDKLDPIRVELNDARDPSHFLISQSQVLSAMNFALREMAMNTAAVEDTIDRITDRFEGLSEGMRKMMKSLLRSLISNGFEEDLSIMHDPAFQYSDEELREQLRDTKLFGIGPGWPSSYVYFGTRLGHYDGLDLFYIHLRYFLQELRGQKIEFWVTKPMPLGFNLSLGVTYTSEEKFHDPGQMAVGKVQLEKVFRNDPMKGAFVFGAAIYKGLDLLVSYRKSF